MALKRLLTLKYLFWLLLEVHFLRMLLVSSNLNKSSWWEQYVLRSLFASSSHLPYFVLAVSKQRAGGNLYLLTTEPLVAASRQRVKIGTSSELCWQQRQICLCVAQFFLRSSITIYCYIGRNCSLQKHIICPMNDFKKLKISDVGFSVFFCLFIWVFGVFCTKSVGCPTLLILFTHSNQCEKSQPFLPIPA